MTGFEEKLIDEVNQLEFKERTNIKHSLLRRVWRDAHLVRDDLKLNKKFVKDLIQVVNLDLMKDMDLKGNRNINVIVTSK